MNSNYLPRANELLRINLEEKIEKIEKDLRAHQAEKSSRLKDSLFSPALYKHYKEVAVMLSKSGITPTSYKGKPEDVFVAMEMGYQLGFPVAQALQDISIINGRPCLWGDGLLSVCLNHVDCESIEETPILNGDTVIGYSCKVKRKGHQIHTQTFTLKDAQHAGLLNRDPWKKYPSRMLQMRARSLALRDKFADALRGLHSADIEQDDAYIFEGKSEPSRLPKTQTENVKEILKNLPASDTKEGNEKVPSVLTKEEKLEKINNLIEKNEWDDVKKLKVFDYFNISKIEDLTEEQADIFIGKLED